MLRYFSPLVGSLLCLPLLNAADLPKPFVSGLKNPESAIVHNGITYITAIGEFDTDGDGGVYKIDGDKVVPFAMKMDDPKGIAAFQNTLYVADKTRVWSIDPSGKATVHLKATDFPIPPVFLNDIAVDAESGTLYISDSGDLKGAGGAVFAVSPKGKIRVVADAKIIPGLHTPNGVQLDGASRLLIGDFGTGVLYRLNLADGKSEKLADGFGGTDGIVWDQFGRLFVSDYKNGKVFGFMRLGEKPVLVAEGFQAAADICLDATGRNLLVPDMKAGTVTAISTQIPGYKVDDSSLSVKTVLAFPNLEWSGWDADDGSGKVIPFRPIVLTHPGDGSNRVMVATEQGVIHTFPNDPKATKSSIFLDLQDRVIYDDKQNEEGFLGLAFHPKFKQNGEFFVFYTPKKAKMTNIVSRFKVRKDDPTRGDPESEEILLSYAKPFWNHNGGSLDFGNDGYLYVTHGDGGSANDPLNNGQNLKTWLGKVLRIDVDHKENGNNYAIPKDNPFVGKGDAKPEIYAYGFRNIWRMAFDRKTGDLWAADVGQNLWEEVNLVQKGGNYGWRLREAAHPFGGDGAGSRKDLIEPIWEYHHDTGKSVTGGTVYRGKQIPELDGSYIYGDYVSGKMWAMQYDPAKKRVVANRPLQDPKLPILSFGQDEAGEVYLLTFSPTGKGIHQLVK